MLDSYIIIAINVGLLIVLSVLFFISLNRKNRLLEKKDKELKIANIESLKMHNKSLALENKELEIANIMSDTTLESEKLKSLAKDELNKYKLKEMGTFERELKQIRKEKLKEIDLEVEQYEKQKLEKTEQLIESKIIEKQKELMQFEEELDDILYETELSHKDKMEAIFTALNKLKSMEEAAVEARRRQYQDENYIEFHSILIDEDEKKQINRLLEVVSTIPGDKIKLAVNKLVFDYYYRNAVDDLIKRVCEDKKLTGIYKITDKENGMCYIGQSVDIGSRWLTHCKRGAGVDSATNNKLYPAMKRKRIYNFTFEIVEVTDNLNEQEKYWAEYFKAKTFGYTMKT